jgi:hypothetical protein
MTGQSVVLGLGDCPTGCGRSVRAGHLMCARCWSQVPRALQLRVYRTWHALTSGSITSKERDAVVEAYESAREDAIASVP